MSLPARAILALGFALLLSTGAGTSPGLASAQPVEDPEPDPAVLVPPPTVYVITPSRLNGGETPRIDGDLTESAWALAEVIDTFVQRDPNEGEPASERTEARILFDDEAIYVAVRAYDSEPELIVGLLTRRDEWSESDWIGISFDSFCDRRTAFDFQVNPAGVERDAYRYDDTNRDSSWNAVWDGAARIDEKGWTAEFRIPFSQLRFSPGAATSWGVQVTRRIVRKSEFDLWKPISKESSRWVSEYGDLVGLDGIEPPPRLELSPYVLGETQQYQREAGNPFEDGSDWTARYGLDLKYGLTSDITLDGTVNPDFGQVEADPSEINLSAFETFFREKRPFFIEGLDRFQFGLQAGDGGSERIFYTRRIGRRPHGSPSGEFVDTPDNTSIIAAAKVSGKTSKGWAVGLVEALTAEEKATVLDGGLESKTVVEPATNYAVARLSKDYREGRSAIGIMGTATNRRLGGTDLGFLHTSAYSVGLDFRHRFDDAGWEFIGKMAGSHVRGAEESIVEDQLGSARYYQRPDAEHLDLDSTRTSLTGTFATLRFGKFSGTYMGGIFGHFRSPGFEVNDLGFMRQSDFENATIWLARRSYTPGRIFREHSENVNAWYGQTTGGEHTSTGGNINGWFQFLNYWAGWWGINVEQEALQPRSLRGGPAILYPSSHNYWLGFESDDRKAVQMSVDGWRWQDAERSYGYGVGTELRVRVSSNLNFNIEPSFNRFVDDWQYVTQDVALGEPQYVMAHLSQNTIALTMRLNWTFTPNLSLQLYASPFISAGEYTGFKRVVAPRAEAYDDRFETFSDDQISTDGESYFVDLDRSGSNDLTFGVPDFNFQEFRSNIVLRWEYVSGSTLFLVYQHERSDFAQDGTFKPAQDFGNLASLQGRSIFLVKLSYWWSL